MRPDLHKLEHLIAVAEEGNLTRAAERLHLSQQALSTSIRALEREVGVRLLDRARSGVTLLAAGEALVADARVLRGVADAAMRRARRIGRGEPDRLRIGHTPAVTGDEVGTLLGTVRGALPEAAAEVNQRYPAELTEQLLAGELDLGLCRAMAPARGLVRTTVGHHRLRIAVAADHPLAGRESVALEELSGERFLIWGTPGRSGYADLLIDHCRRAGFEPVVERNPLQGTPPVTAVLGTDRIAFVTAAPGAASGDRVRVLELHPPHHAPLHALWPQHIPNEARETLLRHSAQ